MHAPALLGPLRDPRVRTCTALKKISRHAVVSLCNCSSACAPDGSTNVWIILFLIWAAMFRPSRTSWCWGFTIPGSTSASSQETMHMQLSACAHNYDYLLAHDSFNALASGGEGRADAATMRTARNDIQTHPNRVFSQPTSTSGWRDSGNPSSRIIIDLLLQEI